MILSVIYCKELVQRDYPLYLRDMYSYSILINEQREAFLFRDCVYVNGKCSFTFISHWLRVSCQLSGKRVYNAGDREDICNCRGVAKQSAMPKFLDLLIKDQPGWLRKGIIVTEQHLSEVAELRLTRSL